MWDSIINFFTPDRQIALAPLFGITLWGYLRIHQELRHLTRQRYFFQELLTKWVELVAEFIKQPEEGTSSDYDNVPAVNLRDKKLPTLNDSAFNWFLLNDARIKRILHQEWIVSDIQFAKSMEYVNCYNDYYELERIRQRLFKFNSLLDDNFNITVEDSRSPMKCLQKGVHSIISMPVGLMKWSKLLSSDQAETFITSKIGQGLSKLLSLLYFIVTLMTLILGWQPIVDVIKGWLA